MAKTSPPPLPAIHNGRVTVQEDRPLPTVSFDRYLGYLAPPHQGLNLPVAGVKNNAPKASLSLSTGVFTTATTLVLPAVLLLPAQGGN